MRNAFKMVTLLLTAHALACGGSAGPAKVEGGTIRQDAGGGEFAPDLPTQDFGVKECTPPPTREDFRQTFNIFSSMGCVGSGCHVNGAGMYGADLRMDTVVEACGQLVNVPAQEDKMGAPATPGPATKMDRVRVKPGDLAGSYLWCKLSSDACGTREPRNHAPIAQFYLDVIKEWITSGARCTFCSN